MEHTEQSRVVFMMPTARLVSKGQENNPLKFRHFPWILIRLLYILNKFQNFLELIASAITIVYQSYSSLFLNLMREILARGFCRGKGVRIGYDNF